MRKIYKYVLVLVVCFGFVNVYCQTPRYVVNKSVFRSWNSWSGETHTYFLGNFSNPIFPTVIPAYPGSYRYDINTVYTIPTNQFPINFSVQASYPLGGTVPSGTILYFNENYPLNTPEISYKFTTNSNSSYAYSLYMQQPSNNTIGYCETTQIYRPSNFDYRDLYNYWENYKWYYRKANSVWTPIYGRFNILNRIFSFNPSQIPDLENYYGNLDIKFDITLRSGNSSTFTETFNSNIVTYNIIPCSPKLINSLTTKVDNNCSNGQTGTATFTFDRDLQVNEYLNVNIVNIDNPSTPIQISFQTLFPATFNPNRQFTTNGLAAGNYRIEYQGWLNGQPETATPTTSNFTITSPPPVTFTTTKTNILCKGDATGTITVTASGGRPNTTYKYSKDSGTTWQDAPLFDNLAQGNYGIIVKDVKDNIECIAPLGIQTVTILEPATNVAFEINNTVISPPTSPSASDGSINVIASGGTGAISYSWANALSPNNSIVNISNLTAQPAGNYICIATDANGCQATITIALIPYYVTIQEIVGIDCFGDTTGKIQATVFGGTPSFSSDWLPTGINTIFEKNNLGANNYTITVNDSEGLSRMASYNLTQPTAILATASINNNVKCYGESNGSINLTVTGGSPNLNYIFEWKNTSNIVVSTIEDPNNLPVGTYSCKITDSKNCEFIITNQIITQPSAVLSIVNPPIYIPITTIGSSTGGIDISISGGTSPYFYLWNNGATSQDLTAIPAGTYTVTVTDLNGCSATDTYTLNPPSPIAVNISLVGQPILCNGTNSGTLKANASGGSLSYTYVWKKNGVTLPQTTQQIINLGAGNYQVTVTDTNANTATSNVFALIQPNALTATVQKTDILCFGQNNGSINLTISGGTFPYTFLWYKDGSPITNTTQNIQNITAGIYTVYITDANNCSPTIINNIQINQPTLALSATVFGINPTGFGLSNGSINLTVSGGSISYTYLWNNGTTTEDLNNIPAGNYTVTITDFNGCQTNKTVTLTQPNALIVSITKTNNILCFGESNGSLKAIPSFGTNPYTYQWKKNGINIGNSQTISNLSLGVYNVVVTDANTNQTNVFYTLTQPDILLASYTSIPIPCNAGAIGSVIANATGGTAPYSYSWSNGETTSTINNLGQGNYICEISDANNCKYMLQAIVNSTSNMIVTSNIQNASCFGNCNGTIQIQIAGGSGNYNVIWNNLPTTSGLTASNLCAGNYSAIVNDNSNNCSIPVSFTIAQPNTLSLNLGLDKTICDGQKVKINGVINGTGNSYNWTSSNGFTANTAEIEVGESGNYTLNITTQNGCIITDTVLITKLTESIKAEFLVASQTYKDEDIILINVSNLSTENYNWILPAQAIKISETPQTVIMKFTETGSYEVKLKTTNTAGCEAMDTKQIIVEENPGLPNASNGNSFIKEFSIYPNPSPSGGTFNVKVSLNQEATISLTLHEIALGTLINQTNLPSAKEHLKEYNLLLSAGVYWMILRTPMGVQTKKIIVN